MNDSYKPNNRAQDQYELWSYPAIDCDQKSEPIDINFDDDILVEQQEEINPRPEPEEDEALRLLKCELDSKVQKVNDLLVKLEGVYTEFNTTLLENIVSCLQQITTKIIHKEFNIDNKLLASMIEGTLNELNGFKECTIRVAKEDEAVLKECLRHRELTVKVSTTLKKGDYKIISNQGQIQAILTDRIAKLFGLPDSC